MKEVKQAKLIYNDREHISSWLEPERRGTYYNGAQEILGLMEIVYILMMVVFTGLYSSIRTQNCILTMSMLYVVLFQ